MKKIDVASVSARSGDYSLRVGVIWRLVGLAPAIGYFTFLYRSFRSKVGLEEGAGAGGY